MKVILATDRDGFQLKETVKNFLLHSGYEVIDLNSTHGSEDFVDSTVNAVQEFRKHEHARAILFDKYGHSFMPANKFKGIICAAVSDEHSAMMTIRHNSTLIINLGSGITGDILAVEIVKTFLEHDYDAGRHQVRIDMLNKLC